MHVRCHPGNIRRMLDSRLKRVRAAKPLLAASLATITKVCGNPSCHCQRGGDKHQAHHLTYKVGGKTQTIYVPFDFLEEVRSWIQEHRRLKRLLQEISQLSLDLVRSHAQEQKHRRGRS